MSNTKGCSLDADILNVFRFDSISDTPVLPSVLLHCDIFSSIQEVYSMRCGVKLNKSPGPDKISARLLKAAAPIIARPLTDLFNMSKT